MVPFQCLIAGVGPSAPSVFRPTAQASLAPVAATSQNSVETVSLSGVRSVHGVAARAAGPDVPPVAAFAPFAGAALAGAAFAGAARVPKVPSATAHTVTALRSHIRRVPGRPVVLSMTFLLLGWGSQKEMAAARPFLQPAPAGHSDVSGASGIFSCRSVHSDLTVAV